MHMVHVSNEMVLMCINLEKTLETITAKAYIKITYKQTSSKSDMKIQNRKNYKS